MTRAKAALADLARDTPMLGDRLYGTADFFAALAARRCWGVVRRNRQLSLHKLQRLRKRRIHGGLMEDWLVHAGSGASAPRQLPALHPLAPRGHALRASSGRAGQRGRRASLS
jgi:hypothetical protein